MVKKIVKTNIKIFNNPILITVIIVILYVIVKKIWKSKNTLGRKISNILKLNNLSEEEKNDKIIELFFNQSATQKITNLDKAIKELDNSITAGDKDAQTKKSNYENTIIDLIYQSAKNIFAPGSFSTDAGNLEDCKSNELITFGKCVLNKLNSYSTTSKEKTDYIDKIQKHIDLEKEKAIKTAQETAVPADYKTTINSDGCHPDREITSDEECKKAAQMNQHDNNFQGGWTPPGCFIDTEPRTSLVGIAKAIGTGRKKYKSVCKKTKGEKLIELLNKKGVVLDEETTKNLLPKKHLGVECNDDSECDPKLNLECKEDDWYIYDDDNIKTEKKKRCVEKCPKGLVNNCRPAYRNQDIDCKKLDKEYPSQYKCISEGKGKELCSGQGKLVKYDSSGVKCKCDKGYSGDRCETNFNPKDWVQSYKGGYGAIAVDPSNIKNDEFKTNLKYKLQGNIKGNGKWQNAACSSSTKGEDHCKNKTNQPAISGVYYTLDECKKGCDRNEECKSITWYPANVDRWIKNSGYPSGSGWCDLNRNIQKDARKSLKNFTGENGQVKELMNGKEGAGTYCNKQKNPKECVKQTNPSDLPVNIMDYNGNPKLADSGYVDVYRGFYDINNTGKCDHYCKWGGNSGGGNPNPYHTTKRGQNSWSCKGKDNKYINFAGKEFNGVFCAGHKYDPRKNRSKWRGQEDARAFNVRGAGDESDFEFAFDGCPRGTGKMVHALSNSNRALCEHICRNDPSCKAIEVNKCDAGKGDKPTNCTGDCYLYRGGDDVLKNGKCDTSGNQKTYVKRSSALKIPGKKRRCELGCNRCGYNWYKKHWNNGNPTKWWNVKCGCCGGTQAQQNACKEVCVPKYKMGEINSLSCPKSHPYDIDDENRCDIVSKKLLPPGKKQGRTIQISDKLGIKGGWTWVPSKCSVQAQGDWAAHYNSGGTTPTELDRNAGYRKICSSIKTEFHTYSETSITGNTLVANKLIHYKKPSPHEIRNSIDINRDLNTPINRKNEEILSILIRVSDRGSSQSKESFKLFIKGERGELDLIIPAGALNKTGKVFKAGVVSRIGKILKVGAVNTGNDGAWWSKFVIKSTLKNSDVIINLPNNSTKLPIDENKKYLSHDTDLRKRKLSQIFANCDRMKSTSCLIDGYSRNPTNRDRCESTAGTPSYSHQSLQNYDEATFKNWLKALYNRAEGDEKTNIINYVRKCQKDPMTSYIFTTELLSDNKPGCYLKTGPDGCIKRKGGHPTSEVEYKWDYGNNIPRKMSNRECNIRRADVARWCGNNQIKHIFKPT